MCGLLDAVCRTVSCRHIWPRLWATWPVVALTSCLQLFLCLSLYPSLSAPLSFSPCSLSPSLSLCFPHLCGPLAVSLCLSVFFSSKPFVSSQTCLRCIVHLFFFFCAAARVRECLAKVSVVGHSLGSIIAHDILMAQPVKGETQIAEDAVGKDVPLLR